MEATLAIMAARPLYCALPEGLMTTHQRAREVAAEVARHEKTRLILNDRGIWRAPAGGHTCETTSPGTGKSKKRNRRRRRRRRREKETV
jgi:prophage tail gpP-like protein